MQSIIADAVSHRARLAWLASALVASLVALALTRPAHAPRHHARHLPFVGQCGESHHVHALPPTATRVHSYYVYY